MKNNRNILLVLALAGASLLAFSCHHQRTLSKNKTAKILSEIYLADQFIKLYPEINAMGDTTLLYAPIFEKYGCTLEDYQNSLNKYIADGRSYRKILLKAREMLEEQIDQINIELLHPKVEKELFVPYELSPEYDKWTRWEWTEVPPADTLTFEQELQKAASEGRWNPLAVRDSILHIYNMADKDDGEAQIIKIAPIPDDAVDLFGWEENPQTRKKSNKK